MPHLKDGLSLKSRLSVFNVLVFHHSVVCLLLTHSCSGESQLIGSAQPIVAIVGDDIILPCHLEPPMDTVAMTVEWARPDLNPRFVHVWRDGLDLLNHQNPSYKGRTSLFMDKLKFGDVSLKLSKVKLSDEGRYRCFCPSLGKETIIKLVVGQSQVICSPQPIVALAGDDVILPCHLEPATSNFSGTVEWTRPDLDPEYIHVHQSGRLVLAGQNPQYKYRTVLFVDELKNGNVSLKLFSVTISDEGTYRLFIPSMWKGSSIQLHVGSVSSPVIEITKSSSGVVLECECKGWYPEPELFWLDGEGNILSAGPPETVRGPYGLYTASSRVTVEKTDTNSFTCRAQQLSINQTRDTQVQVPGDFFMISSRSFAVRISIVLAVVFLCVAAVVFFVLKQPTPSQFLQSRLEEAERQRDENERKLQETEKQKEAAENKYEEFVSKTKEVLQNTKAELEKQLQETKQVHLFWSSEKQKKLLTERLEEIQTLMDAFEVKSEVKSDAAGSSAVSEKISSSTRGLPV